MLKDNVGLSQICPVECKKLVKVFLSQDEVAEALEGVIRLVDYQ